jgi:pyridoxine 4-dehydrogenase
MRLTGEEIWGEPPDKTQAIKTLRRATGLGVNFIDTADAYGPAVSENLIAEALRPYPVLNGAQDAHGFACSRRWPSR